MAIYSDKVNPTRGQRDNYPKFMNDKIFDILYLSKMHFSMNKNEVTVFLKAMKHYRFYV